MSTPYWSGTANGTADTYIVPFPFIARSHVVVKVGGVEVTDFTWPAASSVKLASIPAAGTSIELLRVTPAEPLVEFQPGNSLPLQVLEVATKQPLFRIEEAVLGNAPVIVGDLLPAGGVEGDSLQIDASGNPAWGASVAQDADLRSAEPGKGVDLVPGAAKSADLLSTAVGKGGELVSLRETVPTAATFLKSVSDVLNAGEFELLRAIPKTEWAAIHAATSSYDAASNINALLSDMAQRGGTLILPHGQIKVGSGLLLDYSGYPNDEKNTRIALRGQGAKSSEIKLTASAGSALTVIGAWPHSTSLELSSLRLTGSVGITRALTLNGVAHASLYDVVMRGAYLGLELIDVLALNWVNSSAVFNTCGVKATRSNKTFPNLFNLNGGGIGGNTLYGMLVEGGCVTNLEGMGFEGNGGGISTPSEGFGFKAFDPGTEGRNVCNIHGCYFEGNKGMADVWVSVPSHDVAATFTGNTFNRLSSTAYVQNCIRLETSGSGKIQAEVSGNGFFRAGDYAAADGRRTVLGTGAASSVNITLGPNSYSDPLVDPPFLNQAGRLADTLKNTPQAWARVGGDGVLQSASQVYSCVKDSEGLYTLTFMHGITAARCYQITPDSSSNIRTQIFSEAGNTVQILFTNGGASESPTRFYVTVYG